MAQIGTSANSHGNQIWKSLCKQTETFEVVGYAFPEGEREKFPKKAPNFDGCREMTVELEYSAISAGTERANFLGDRNGIGVAEGAEAVFPRTVGYSGAGVVCALGSGVSDLSVGDRVFVAWGKHQKQMTVKRSKVLKIPDGVSTKEASMALIATFPLAAIRKTRFPIGVLFDWSRV